MAEKKTYWMANASGEKAQISGAEERDRWIPRGWADADEPADTDFVWMEHESDEVVAPARIPWGARDYWQGIGFAPSAPPEPVDLTRDPHLRDQPTKAQQAATAAEKSNAEGEKSNKSSAAEKTAATDKKQEG